MEEFKEYAKYYDLLYYDKDYDGEAGYIVSLLKKYAPKAHSILELGCGTGKHADIISHEGYDIIGLDVSADMLKKAHERATANSRIHFQQSDIRDYDLGRKFDAAVSLFHVMSYQNSDEDFINVLDTAGKHLEKDSVFIFDCWYGPAVLLQQPEVRVKRFENGSLKITRIAEPEIDEARNICTVNYDVFVTDKEKGTVHEIREQHNMRYFFDNDIKYLSDKCGYEVVDKFEFMSGKPLGRDTWGSCFVLRKIR